MSFQTAARGRASRRVARRRISIGVGSAGGACAPPLAGALPGAAVDAGVDAGVDVGVLAAGAVAFGGAVIALKFVPSTTLTSASTTDLSSTSLPTPPR